jgi:hypothetical protein
MSGSVMFNFHASNPSAAAFLDDGYIWAFPTSGWLKPSVGEDFEFSEDHRGPHEDKAVVYCKGVVTKVCHNVFGNSGKGLPEAHVTIYVDVSDLSLWEAEGGCAKEVLKLTEGEGQ